MAQVILAVVAKRGLNRPLPRLIWADDAAALASLEDGSDDVIYSLTLDSSGWID